MVSRLPTAQGLGLSARQAGGLVAELGSHETDVNGVGETQATVVENVLPLLLDPPAAARHGDLGGRQVFHNVAATSSALVGLR